MAKVKKIEDAGDDRVSIPLCMLRGNMELLLEKTVPCEGVSLSWYEEAGVVLQFHGSPEHHAAWAEMGFRTRALD